MAARLDDPITLNVLWTRMVSIAEEMGVVLARSAFSTVLREGLDYSTGVFDSNGNMLAQGNSAATGHIGSMPFLVKKLFEYFPSEDLRPGDVLMTNDPWLGSGQMNDVYIVVPAFVNNRLAAIAVSSAHMLDIGGRLASVDAREIYEEGLWLPPLKLYDRGNRVDVVMRIIEKNVRMPEKVIGDLHSMVAATRGAVTRLTETMEEYAIEDLTPVAELIINRTEQGIREGIRGIPDGIYHSELVLEETDRLENHLVIKMRVEVDGDMMFIDYAGTSAQVDKPFNATLNYTRSYTVLGAKILANPDLPNNEGSYRAIHVSAPEGSILNCVPPAPLHWRHIMGLRLPELVFRALAPAIPTRVLAGSGGCPVWLYTISGRRNNRRHFLVATHGMGGLGASMEKDGLSSVSFPANCRNFPAEIIESETPILVEHRGLVMDSGGPGRRRGGLGEEIAFLRPDNADVVENGPIVFPLFPARQLTRAFGLFGGRQGSEARILINGEPTRRLSGQEIHLYPNDRVTLHVPGGGGFGDPLEREPECVQRDVLMNFVSIESARDDYCVVIDPLTCNVDAEATEILRREKLGSLLLVSEGREEQ